MSESRHPTKLQTIKDYLLAFRSIRALYPEFPLQFALVSILFLLISFTSSYTPLFLRQATNEVGAKGQEFYIYAVAYAACWTLENVLQNVKGIFSAGVLARTDAALSKTFFCALSNYPYLEKRKIDPGTVASDIDRGAMAFSSITSSFFWAIVPLIVEFLSALTIIYITIGAKFSMLFGTCIFSLAFISYSIASRSGNIHSSIFTAQNNVHSYLVERLGALPDFGPNLSVAREEKIIDAHLSRFVSVVRTANLKMGLYLGLQALAIGVVLGIFTIYSVHLNASVQFTSGDFAMIAGYIGMLTAQLRHLSGALIELRRNQVALATGLKYLSSENSLAPVGPREISPQKLHPCPVFLVSAIDLKIGDRPLLRKFSCIFEKNKTTVISAPSGTGKTSLVLAMLGMIPYSEGRIDFDGSRVDSMSSAAIFEQIAFASQAGHIFNSSLRFNLTYGTDQQIPDTELIQLLAKFEYTTSAAAANLSILDEKIGAGGRSLSGGEIQKVVIMRALLRKKEILILDEPTAALNSELAQKVISFVATQCSTLIVITHDEKITASADRIIRLPIIDTQKVFARQKVFEREHRQ